MALAVNESFHNESREESILKADKSLLEKSVERSR